MAARKQVSPQSDAHLKNVKRWFGTHAQEWSDLYKDVQRVNDLVLINRKNITVEALVERLPKGARILDAGCGAGPVALDLARLGFFVHGVDIAQEMIDLAEEDFARQGIPRDRFLFTQGDVVEAPLEPDSFDAVIALGVLQYQTSQEPMLRAFHRLLKPGGIAIVTGPIEFQIPNFFCVPAAAGKMLRKIGALKSPQPRGQTRYRYRVNKYKNVLRSFGFDRIDHVGHGFANWAVIGPWIGFRGELVLHRFFTGLSKALPISHWANDLVFIARKAPAK